MRNLLLLVLLAVVRSTPLNSETQDEVYREAETDGYLVYHRFLTPPTTQSPKRTPPVRAARQLSNEGDMAEGSGMGEDGSGSGAMPAIFTTSTTSSTSTAGAIRRLAVDPLRASEGSGSEPDSGSRSGRANIAQTHQDLVNPALSKDQGTPGWIIIVAFIVGLAALVMLFVAIATRDKWNGPSIASQLEPKASPSDQETGLEMETFLQKDKPRENGKAAEYTVIPLEELPENCSSSH